MDHHGLPANLDSHGRLRQVTQESRNHSKNKAMALRRLGLDSLESEDTYSLEGFLATVKAQSSVTKLGSYASKKYWLVAKSILTIFSKATKPLSIYTAFPMQ